MSAFYIRSSECGQLPLSCVEEEEPQLKPDKRLVYALRCPMGLPYMPEKATRISRVGFPQRSTSKRALIIKIKSSTSIPNPTAPGTACMHLYFRTTLSVRLEAETRVQKL